MPGSLRAFSQSLIVVLVAFLAAMAVVTWHRELPLLQQERNFLFPFKFSDGEEYSKIAEGGLAQTASPFSKRLLYPWLADTFATVFHQSLPSVFLWLSLLSFLTLAFCLAEILRITTGQPLAALWFLLTPLPLESFEMAYMPDLFHMALVSLFFLLLLRGAKLACLAVLFTAFLARENTLLLCLFTAGLGWVCRERLMMVGSLIVLAAGQIFTSMFAGMGQPNRHHLPDSLYTLGKLPYYFLLNLFGIRIWSNVRPNEGTPLTTWHLPHWLRIGADNVVGITAPDWRYPALTLIVWLTVFGIGPVVLFYLLKEHGTFKSLPFAAKVALVYGLFSFVIGPFLGDWVNRLVFYGWPAFWIAMPTMFCLSGRRPEGRQACLLCAVYWLVSWWPSFTGYDDARNANPSLCAIVLLFYVIAFVVLKAKARRLAYR